ncbi:MAG TPA: sensor domain-containing protein [Mycobacterium sp.]|nr:sensor domain-containing protein [Mycobacterium sp.]
MLTGCTRVVGGAAALPATQTPGPMLPPGVDVEQIMLDSGQMRAITGASDHLTIIPTMDVKSPVDIGALADTVPASCRFVYAETATFGTETTQFHKTTFQYPPKAALISEAAAAYRDIGAARRIFDTLVSTVSGCADTSSGAILVGGWDADEQSLHTGAGRCGSNYRLKSAVLLEVTFCGFPKSVSQIVLTNLANRVPG